jgi:hypothetical protein
VLARWNKLFAFPAFILTTMPIAWMHAASESLLIRNPLQKGGELPLFVLGDRHEQCLGMFAGDASYYLECRASFFREVQSITAAIVGILAALD